MEIFHTGFVAYDTIAYLNAVHKTFGRKLVRVYSSDDTLYNVPNVNIPLYWIRPQQILSGEPGSHRFLWDMHYSPLNVPASYPIAAIYNNTAPNETSPWVMPGLYSVHLTVDDKEYAETFYIKMDPRVKTSLKDLQLQHDLSVMCYNNIEMCKSELNRLDANSDKAKALAKYMGNFTGIQNALQDSDWPPTIQMINAAKENELSFKQFLKTMH